MEAGLCGVVPALIDDLSSPASSEQNYLLFHS